MRSVSVAAMAMSDLLGGNDREVRNAKKKRKGLGEYLKLRKTCWELLQEQARTRGGPGVYKRGWDEHERAGTTTNGQGRA